MALRLHGRLSYPYKKTPCGNRRGTPTTTRRVCSHCPRYFGRKRSLSQTRKMCFRAKRDRLSRSYRRTRYPKNGPQKNTRSSGLVSTKNRYRSTPILGVHRILPVLHPELFKNCPTTPGPHKKDDSMALGPTSVQSIRDPQDPHVPKTCPAPTQLHKTLLPPNRRIC